MEEKFREEAGDFCRSVDPISHVRECVICPKSQDLLAKKESDCLKCWKVLSGCRNENGENGTAQKVGAYLSKLLLSSKQEMVVISTRAVTMGTESHWWRGALSAREDQQGALFSAHFPPSSAPSHRNNFSRSLCRRDHPILLSVVPPAGPGDGRRGIWGDGNGVCGPRLG